MDLPNTMVRYPFTPYPDCTHTKAKVYAPSMAQIQKPGKLVMTTVRYYDLSKTSKLVHLASYSSYSFHPMPNAYDRPHPTTTSSMQHA